MTAAALMESDVCVYCVHDHGLCRAHRCRRPVLPQLKQPAYIRRAGDVLTEQTKRQSPINGSLGEIARIGRRNARRQARVSKRGPFAAIKAMQHNALMDQGTP